MIRKIGLGLLLIGLFLSSTHAVSTYAPDQLALTPGSYSSGFTSIDLSMGIDDRLFVEYDTTFKVLEILDFPDISNKLVRFGVSITLLTFPSSEYSVVGFVYDYEYLVWYHNRSIAVPMTYIKITNGTTVVKASLLGEDTFAEVSDLNNMVVTLSDGREFLWEDFVMVSSLEPEAVILGNYVMDRWNTEIYLRSIEQYAISPEASIGQFINYGWFNGEVVDSFALKIGGETHDVLKVHIDYQESALIWKEEYTTISTIIVIHESLYLYEAKTGLLANFTQFSETGYPFGHYIANDLHIAEPDDSGNTLTIPYDYLFSILGLGFMVSLALLKKRKSKSILSS
ncbi:MAG: hypothetical protein ACTSQF_04360 [Candidatus Heimdallarchaeaceae archaeon]